MAARKSNVNNTKMTESEYFQTIRSALYELNVGLAVNMLKDLKTPDRCSPALYNACIKFLSMNDITCNRVNVEDDKSALSKTLESLNNEYEHMLIDYELE